MPQKSHLKIMTTHHEDLPAIVSSNQPRDQKIIEMRLAGRSQPEVAKAVGCSVRTVARVMARNPELAERLRERAQMIAVDKLQESMSDVMDALIETAKDMDSRNQAQTAGVAGELTGLIGKQHVHIGDNVTTNVQVNVEGDFTFDPVEHAKLMEKLGAG